jgi:triacylglycerol lipase
VVVLPLAYTHEPGGVQRLARWLLAAPLAELFRRRQQGHSAHCPVYYLGGVAADGPNLHPELALVATSLGWPCGPFVLVPCRTADAAEALAGALDRLRWLLAGRLELLVINQEPAADSALAAAVRPMPDRAIVTRLARTGEDLHGVCKRPAAVTPHLLPRTARPTRSRSVPRHPLVFCHGMLAMTMLRMQIPKDTNYFVHLRPFLSERGIHALFPNVEPTGGVAARAEQLRDQVRHWTDEPINVIAHSMGGLDARFLISRLGLADQVRSLTTIATPHRGSALAYWACVNFHQRVPLLLTLKAFGVDVDGFADCRPGVCQEFNERTPDAPGVRYFSYSAAVTPPRITPMLRRSWNLLTPLEGPNDGIVSVKSARWGEDVGTLAVDHFAQTPDLLFVRPDENFDTLGFYSRLVEDLARRGL